MGVFRWLLGRGGGDVFRICVLLWKVVFEIEGKSWGGGYVRKVENVFRGGKCMFF